MTTRRAGQGSLSPEQRSAKARKAVTARWDKHHREDWKPKPAQLRALEIVCEKPALASKPTQLAKAIGVSADTERRWRRDPNFRIWWNQSLQELARALIGPALLQVVVKATDPKIKPSELSKLVDTLAKHVKPEQITDTTGALMKLLEKFKGKRLRAAVEIEGEEYPTPDDLPQGSEGGEACETGPEYSGKGGIHGAPTRRPRVRLEVDADEQQLRDMGALVSGPASLEDSARRTLNELEVESSAATAEDQPIDPSATPDEKEDSEAESAGAGWSSAESDHVSPGGGRSEIAIARPKPKGPRTYDESKPSVCPPHDWAESIGGDPVCLVCGLVVPLPEHSSPEGPGPGAPTPESAPASSDREAGSSGTSSGQGRLMDRVDGVEREGAS